MQGEGNGEHQHLLGDIMIRVLHFAGIINRFDFIDSVVSRLDRSKFVISGLTSVPARRVAPYPSEQKYPTKVLNFQFNRWNYARMFLALMREVRSFRPHVLHAHHFDENVVASAVARIARVPCYIIGHHYSEHIYYLTKGFKRKFFIGIENACNSTASHVVVPAQEVATLLTERQGLAPEKVSVIPYGLELDSYQMPPPDKLARFRREHDLDDKLVLLTSCRLNEEKGLQFLLRAMPEIIRQISRVCLVLLGNGPYEEELRRLTCELQLQDVVRFEGWKDNPIAWMSAADVVIQPSLCESFCQVLLEALALAKPVVMTPVGAAPEVIGENTRGRLVPKRDSGAIVDAVVELAKAPDLARRLGQEGRDFVRKTMRPEEIAKRHETLYEKLLAINGVGPLVIKALNDNPIIRQGDQGF